MSHRANTSIEIRLFKAVKTNSWRAVSLIELIFPASSRIISERDRPCYSYSGNPIRISPHIPHCHELKCVIQFHTASKTRKNPTKSIPLFLPMPVLPGVFKSDIIKVFNRADPKKQIGVRRICGRPQHKGETLLQIMAFAAVTPTQSQEQEAEPQDGTKRSRRRSQELCLHLHRAPSEL